MNGESENDWKEKLYPGYCLHKFHNVRSEFDPVKNYRLLTQWIEKIEKFSELYGWDGIAISHYALSKLLGVANTWRDSLTCEARSWETKKDLLVKTFSVQASDINLKFEAQNYKWIHNQDMVEYYFEKLSKCKKCNMKLLCFIESNTFL